MPAGVGQDDVEHLALAGIVGAVEVARAELDPHHALRRDALQGRVERFRLGARPGAVDDDIARRPGEAAHVGAVLAGAEVELEAGNVLDDVVARCAARIGRNKRRRRPSSGPLGAAAGGVAGAWASAGQRQARPPRLAPASNQFDASLFPCSVARRRRHGSERAAIALRSIDRRFDRDLAGRTSGRTAHRARAPNIFDLDQLVDRRASCSAPTERDELRRDAERLELDQRIHRQVAVADAIEPGDELRA